PFILRISKLWSAWVAHQGKTHVYIKELHDRYGPIVRIGPNELSTVEKNLIPQILGNQGMPKGPMWDGRKGFADGKDALISARSTALHAEMRAPWNKAFSSEAIKIYEERLIQRVVELDTRLRKKCSQETAVIDIAKFISCFTYDAMGDVAFAGDSQLMENDDQDDHLETMDMAMYFMSVAQHIPWFGLLFSSLPIVNGLGKQFIKQGIDYSIKRSQMELKHKDVFYFMGEASGGSGFDFNMIIQNSLLAIVAGSDTTASAMSNAIYLLLTHPGEHRKLRQEIDSVFAENEIDLGAPGAVSRSYGEILGSMKYLNSVINETLRLFPSVPTDLQRAPEKGTSSKVLQSEDTTIILPEGNSIIVPPYTLHRDPRYFSPRPEAFIPERWLASPTDEKYTTTRDMYIPFSMGPSNCVGRSFALLEMRYTLAILVRNFDMEFAEPHAYPASWLEGLKDHYTFQKGPLNVKLSLRHRD
ncbi:hypothetical protein CVT26_006346, partial [Gymnopilus dilepis]